MTEEEYKSMKKAIKHLQEETSSAGLRYKKLDMDTIRLVVVTDACFENAQRMKTQLGYAIMLVDAIGTEKLVHFGSNRFRRVTRSVVASEVHVLVFGFYFAYVIGYMVLEILGH